MVDSFSLALSHGLILLAVWRLFWRPDLDSDDAAQPTPSAEPKPARLPFLKGRKSA